MTRSELVERIEVWLMINEQNPLPEPQTPLGVVAAMITEREWTASLLHNVTEMTAVPEILGTPAEDWLGEARRLAASGAADVVPAIRELLRRTHSTLVTPRV
jgi:hypothetical protein